MNPVDAIAAVGPSSLPGAASVFPVQKPAVTLDTNPVGNASPLGNFGQLLTQGLSQANEKINTADQLVRSFALDESSVPIHQVTIALEEARLAVELAMQVRTRLVEAYRELMNTQL